MAMTQIQKIIEENEKEWEKVFSRMLQCLYGGEESENEAKEIIKSFLRSSQNQLIEKVIEEVERMIKSFKPWRVTEDEYTRGKKNGYREALQEVINHLREKDGINN